MVFPLKLWILLQDSKELKYSTHHQQSISKLKTSLLRLPLALCHLTSFREMKKVILSNISYIILRSIIKLVKKSNFCDDRKKVQGQSGEDKSQIDLKFNCWFISFVPSALCHQGDIFQHIVPFGGYRSTNSLRANLYNEYHQYLTLFFLVRRIHDHRMPQPGQLLQKNK